MVYNSLNTLVKDTGVLRDYTGLSLSILQVGGRGVTSRAKRGEQVNGVGQRKESTVRTAGRQQVVPGVTRSIVQRQFLQHTRVPSCLQLFPSTHRTASSGATRPSARPRRCWTTTPPPTTTCTTTRPPPTTTSTCPSSSG